MQPLQLGLYLLHLNLKNRSHFTATVSELETFLGSLVLFRTAPSGARPAGAPLPTQQPAEIIHRHGRAALWGFCLHVCTERGTYLQKGCWNLAHPFPGRVLVCHVFQPIKTGRTAFCISL